MLLPEQYCDMVETLMKEDGYSIRKETYMKIRVNTRRIEKLNPCEDRLENWKRHHANFDGDITEFLRLEGITPQDKVWVAVRLMPRFLVEVFAIDCAMNAAANAAANATDAANAFWDAERQRQVEALIHLISTTTRKECKALS